jgi:peptidoglycan/xylan/chitin deacetylase (PgdA/CDA1 family)
MLRSMLIKVPTLLAVAAILLLGSGPLAWLGAAAALLAGLGLLGWQIFHPNAGLWAKTLWRASAPVNAVALTFDDGPDPAFTPEVLRILAEKGAPATFFVVGSRALAHPEILARIDAAGHLVENHSHSHDLRFHFHLWGPLRRELAACNAAIRAAIGREPALFRSPQGFKNPALGDVLRERGMTAVGWQVRGFDAVGTDARAIEARIVAGALPGGVVLMHDGSGLNGTADRTPTLEALPRIIDALRARGLELVRLDALLGVEAYR